MRPEFMDNLIIRIATEQEIPEVCRLVQQMSPGSPHDYRNAIEKYKTCIKPSPDYFLWIAMHFEFEPRGWIVVGTAMMHLQHKLSYNCGVAVHLEDVVVDVNYRGMGIGEALVNAAIEKAKEHKAYKLMLTCYEKTIPYYEKFGFSRHDIGMRLDLKELYPKGTE